MEPLQINYWAVLLGAVLSMVIGSIWYGPLFGKKWAEILGVNTKDKKQMKEMQESAMPLYFVQFILTLFQVLVLSHLVADTERVGGIERSLWICAAFVMPTLAGSVMWTNESTEKKWSRFLIQLFYYFILFFVFGAVLQFWK